MRNIIILIALFSILSCEKESGFIPEPDLNDPHYSEMKPELQWRTKVPFYVNLDNHHIIDDLLIAYGSKKNDSLDETIEAYQLTDGERLWTLDISNLLQGTHIRDFHVLKEGQTLYFIDLNEGKTFLINAENGNLIELRTLNGINTFHPFKAYIKGQSYYHLDYKRAESLFTLIKYDIISHEIEEIMDLSGYPLISGVSHALYHESDNILYLSANIDHKKIVLLALDLNTKQIHELWGNSDSGNYIPLQQKPVVLIDDKLIFDGGLGELIAVNRASGMEEWVLKRNIYHLFTHLNNVYILTGNHNNHLMAIDHRTGEIKWVNIGATILSNISLHPDEDLLIGVNKTYGYTFKAAIYDLTNGQKLVEWSAPSNEEGELPIERFATYHEETNSIYLGAETTGELIKYNWPLP